MTIEDKFTAAARLALLGLVGVVALTVLDLMRYPETMAEAPHGFFVGIWCVAATPVILLTLGRQSWVRWSSLVLTGLLALFHALHIVEHAIGGDMAGVVLILTTMFVPSVSAAWLLFKAK